MRRPPRPLRPPSRPSSSAAAPAPAPTPAAAPAAPAPAAKEPAKAEPAKAEPAKPAVVAARRAEARSRAGKTRCIAQRRNPRRREWHGRKPGLTQNVDAYLAFYGKDFKAPGGESRARLGERRAVSASARPSRISTCQGRSRRKVSMSAGTDQASVTFRQGYSSDVLKGANTTKTLVLVENRRALAHSAGEGRQLTSLRRAWPQLAAAALLVIACSVQARGADTGCDSGAGPDTSPHLACWRRSKPTALDLATAARRGADRRASEFPSRAPDPRRPADGTRAARWRHSATSPKTVPREKVEDLRDRGVRCACARCVTGHNGDRVPR